MPILSVENILRILLFTVEQTVEAGTRRTTAEHTIALAVSKAVAEAKAAESELSHPRDQIRCL